MNFLKSAKAQMLVEALLAMGVIVVALIAIVSLASRSIGQSRVVADEFIAVNLASEGLELTKNILDSNVINRLPWNKDFENGQYEVDYLSSSLRRISTPRQLLFDPNSAIYSYGNGEPTSFTRVVTIQVVDAAYHIRAKGEVSWRTKGGQNKSVSLETDFLNWR